MSGYHYCYVVTYDEVDYDPEFHRETVEDNWYHDREEAEYDAQLLSRSCEGVDIRKKRCHCSS